MIKILILEFNVINLIVVLANRIIEQLFSIVLTFNLLSNF
jgi:hypothetical protein